MLRIPLSTRDQTRAGYVQYLYLNPDTSSLAPTLVFWDCLWWEDALARVKKKGPHSSHSKEGMFKQVYHEAGNDGGTSCSTKWTTGSWLQPSCWDQRRAVMYMIQRRSDTEHRAGSVPIHGSTAFSCTVYRDTIDIHPRFTFQSLWANLGQQWWIHGAGAGKAKR